MTQGAGTIGQAADVQRKVAGANRAPDVNPRAGETVADSRAPARRLPDFFIVGHGKAGTTALFLMLKAHPQLHLPVKEPRFFAPELRSRYWRPPSSRRLHPRTLDGYISLFAAARPEQRIGEATVDYLRSTTAASRIAEVRPDARIIVILREPASFLRSYHLQCVRNYDENKTDFREAMELVEARRKGKRMPLFSQSPGVLLYSDHVKYVEQLRRFHAVFPPENVLVLIYDDFRRDNEKTVREVLRFLEVDDTDPIPPVKLESLRIPRSRLLDQFARGLTMVRREKGKPGPLSRAIWRRVLRDPPPPDEQFMLELRRRFKPEVAALSEYLDRDLVALWGYDRID